MKDRYWKYVGPYYLPPEGKWINDNIKIEGACGAGLIREAETGAVQFLVVNGQLFQLEDCD